MKPAFSPAGLRLAERIARSRFVAPFTRRLLDRVRHEVLLDASFLAGDGDLAFDRRRWVIKETAFGARLWVSLEERAISRAILTDCYELAETRLIARLVRPGDTAIDIGANIGYHALHCAQLTGPAGRVHAFEPLGYLADVLERNIAENGFAHVTLHRLALAEAAGSATIRHAPRTPNFGGGHLAPSTPVPGMHADEPATMARLDDVLAGEPCHFLKIDVEGAEPRVLAGAAQTLAKSRPRILCELHNSQLQMVSASNADALLAQMRTAGYHATTIAQDGSPESDIRTYAGAAPLNVLFVPAP